MSDAGENMQPIALDDEEPTLLQVVREEIREPKWLVLAVACFLTFGISYCLDFPGSIGYGQGQTIQTYFESQGRHYTQSMNQLLYSIYSWPNTVLALVGGILIDKVLGIRRAMALFVALVFTGAVVFAVGVRWTSFPVMLLGRVIFGLGGESLGVSQSTFIARWFSNKRGMALAFGITISFARIGSSLSFLCAPMLAESRGVSAAVLSGVAACLVSALSCAALIAADVYAASVGYIEDEVLGEETFLRQVMDIKKLKLPFWLLCAICVSCYMAIFNFIGISKNFFQEKYGYTVLEASRYISLYLLASATLSPLVGLAVDGVGRNTYWLLASAAGFAGVHSLFLASHVPAYVLMVVMGVIYSFLVSSLWPGVPMTVPIDVTGIAYGVMTSVQNLGMASLSIAVGYVLDKYADADGSDKEKGALPRKYLFTETIFLTCTAVAVVSAAALLFYDIKSRGPLSLSRAERADWVPPVEEEEEVVLEQDGDASAAAPMLG